MANSTALDTKQREHITQTLASALDRVARPGATFAVRGKVVEAIGIIVKASGINARIGDVCNLVSPDGTSTMAEVVGFSDKGTLLVPFAGLPGISAATVVIPTDRPHEISVGQDLIGRVLDGFGNPIDGLGDLQTRQLSKVHRAPPHPLERRMIDKRLTTGVRAIDGMLTFGEGQRIGIFSPAGVGKSTLLGMLACNADADINVIAMIGERGREVREFIEHSLGPEGRKRSICVVATSEKSALERTRAAYVATTIAEFFRDQGKRVLLIMDSLTRFARGQREIGLAGGEPATRRGYPPSLFAELPKLLERAGQGKTGSITALYTVLMEDDQTADPVAEEVRSILDGHIILSRDLAGRGHYPAIDVQASISRVMPAVATRDHMQQAGRVRELMAKYADIELLVQIGEYRSGTDRMGDIALKAHDGIVGFLRQATSEATPFDRTAATLASLATQ
jgi:type III secretion protein N (ATPase)